MSGDYGNPNSNQNQNFNQKRKAPMQGNQYQKRHCSNDRGPPDRYPKDIIINTRFRMSHGASSAGSRHNNSIVSCVPRGTDSY